MTDLNFDAMPDSRSLTDAELVARIEGRLIQAEFDRSRLASQLARLEKEIAECQGLIAERPPAPVITAEALRDEIREALSPWYSSARTTMRLAVGETVEWILSRYELHLRPVQPPLGYVPSRHPPQLPDGQPQS